ncbi:hypothetical protein CTRI78_v002316 [Colletotrichum trifolii]|uniref:Uncharacterized protein n=1 Tax=Colletotrichum trifolii TaxID=5466 RepID=A0A4R8RMD5_COLTR|nr:hypothetical protein CTRI78_v002316 [Colletotrichum trifolii]
MASTSSSSDLRERIEATARAFLSAFEEVSAQNDVSIINRDVTADCTRHLLPASVPEACGLPAGFFFDNATYFEAVSKDNKVLKFRKQHPFQLGHRYRRPPSLLHVRRRGASRQRRGVVPGRDGLVLVL